MVRRVVDDAVEERIERVDGPDDDEERVALRPHVDLGRHVLGPAVAHARQHALERREAARWSLAAGPGRGRAPCPTFAALSILTTLSTISAGRCRSLARPPPRLRLGPLRSLCPLRPFCTFRRFEGPNGLNPPEYDRRLPDLIDGEEGAPLEVLPELQVHLKQGGE